jgi:hypothetical protein
VEAVSGLNSPPVALNFVTTSESHLLSIALVLPADREFWSRFGAECGQNGDPFTGFPPVSGHDPD